MSFKGFVVETLPRFRHGVKVGEYRRSVNIQRRMLKARMARLGLTTGRQKVRLRKAAKRRRFGR